MTSTPSISETAPASSAFSDALSIARYHIVLIAMTASLVFGWLTTGRYGFGLALVVGLDWFLINLFNKVTDVEEDLENGIPGTERVAKWKRFLAPGCFALLGLSFLSHLPFPEITPLRVIVQLIGLAYSYRLVPTPSGMKRIKQLYFFKNFGSAFLFVLTCLAYPIAIAGWSPTVPWIFVAALALFFVPFEVSYEILYDFRDLPGDRREGIPTFPVVHGPVIAQRLIDALLVTSVVVIAIAVLTGAFGLRELLFIVAPIAQWFFYRPRLTRGLTSNDCIVLTHLGSAQLVFFLIGTRVWLAMDLPENVFVPWA
ncbi:MAG: UbiA family prenyltransferase [Deltaproteobacteria bacterium]|nr:UbiA family prenyltransferase [Deltaproteobacteria bacterium]